MKPTRLMTLVLGLLGGLLAAAATCAWFEIREAGFERIVGGLVPDPARA